MNELKNIFNARKDVFTFLKDYIQENASITTKVSEFVLEDKSPLIVFMEERNELTSKSTTYDNTTRALSYRIDIYCKKLPNCKKICEELALLVNMVMEGIYKMEGGVYASTRNYDGKSEQSCNILMRYNSKFVPKNNYLY